MWLKSINRNFEHWFESAVLATAWAYTVLYSHWSIRYEQKYWNLMAYRNGIVCKSNSSFTVKLSQWRYRKFSGSYLLAFAAGPIHGHSYWLICPIQTTGICIAILTVFQFESITIFCNLAKFRVWNQCGILSDDLHWHSFGSTGVLHLRIQIRGLKM